MPTRTLLPVKATADEESLLSSFSDLRAGWEVDEYIEPLTGIARHPLFKMPGCPWRNGSIQRHGKFDIGYLILTNHCDEQGHPRQRCSSGRPARARNLLFDLGCSTYSGNVSLKKGSGIGPSTTTPTPNRPHHRPHRHPHQPHSPPPPPGLHALHTRHLTASLPLFYVFSPLPHTSPHHLILTAHLLRLPAPAATAPHPPPPTRTPPHSRLLRTATRRHHPPHLTHPEHTPHRHHRPPPPTRPLRHTSTLSRRTSPLLLRPTCPRWIPPPRHPLRPPPAPHAIAITPHLPEPPHRHPPLQ